MRKTECRLTERKRTKRSRRLRNRWAALPIEREADMDKMNEKKKEGWKFAALENNRLDLDDRFCFSCDNCGGEVFVFIREIEKQVADENLMHVIWNMVISLLYVRYDTGKEFLLQFRKNLHELKQNFREIKSLGGAAS